MKNLYGLLLIIVGILWGIGLFWGYITGLQKSFKSDKQMEALDSSKIKRKQKSIAQDAEEKRKQMMEDHKQRLKDYQNKF